MNDEPRTVAGSAPVYKTLTFGDLILGDSPPVDAKLRTSIGLWGLLDAVIVRPWRDKYKVIAGNRRCKAIRDVALEEGLPVGDQPVYCRIIEDKEYALAAMVATNNARKNNPLSDLAAIIDRTDKLLKKGMTQAEIEKELYRELGLSIATQRKRLRLKLLAPEFKIAIIERRLTIAAAEQIAGLDAKRQKRLLKLLDERGVNGRLTMADVKEQKLAATHAYTDSLPWGQIVQPEAQ